MSGQLVIMKKKAHLAYLIKGCILFIRWVETNQDFKIKLERAKVSLLNEALIG
jgi:hypothetical protein